MTWLRKPIRTAESRGERAAARPAASPDPELEALFDQYWEQVCRVLYRLIGDWAEAEELALEVFVRLHRRPLEAGANLGSWFYRVATRLGLNALRARRRRRHYEETAASLDLQTGPDWDPATLIEKAQEREAVRRALAALKPRAAQLLVLRYSGLSYAELAEALDVAPGSVGTLLARAEKEFERQYRAQSQ